MAPATRTDRDEQPSGRMARVEAALAARRGRVLVALLVLATTLRIVAFSQLADSPAAWVHHWADSDMHFFDAWGRRVADGDLLSDGSLHPYHGWHADIAALHFDDHPEDEAALTAQAAATGEVRPAGQLLWERWFGGPRFHQEPLYAYLVGLTYWLAGPDVLAVFAWQLALGVATVLLVWFLGRRLGGELVGLIAGLAASFCGPLLLYEMTLLRTSLLVFAGVGLTALLAASTSVTTPRRWALVGVACALAVLLKTTFLVFLVAAVAWPLVTLLHRYRGPALRLSAAVVAGAALVLSLAVGRNLAVGAPATSLTSVLPLNAILSWSPAAHVRIDGFAPNLLDFADVMGRTDGQTLPVLSETLLAEDPRGARLRACLLRFANAWHAFEAPNNVNLYYARLHAPVLSVAGVGLGSAGPLALVGLALIALGWRAASRRAAGPTWPLVLLVVATLLPLVAFGTLARYRILFVVALLPFAAVVPVAIAERLADRRWAGAAALLAFVLAGTAAIHRPLPDDVTPIRSVDYVMPYRYFYGPVADHLVGQGQPGAAADVLSASLRIQPPEVLSLGPDRPAAHMGEAHLAEEYAAIQRVLAQCCELAGRSDEALAARARADELARAAALP